MIQKSWCSAHKSSTRKRAHVSTIASLGLVATCYLMQSYFRTLGKQLDSTSKLRTKRQICLCGYKVDELANVVFPDYTLADSCHGVFNVNDILLVGMHLACDVATRFPGTVIYVNGEAFLADMVNGSHYLGPTSKETQRVHQLYYVTVASLHFPRSYESFRSRIHVVPEKFLLHISSRCLPHRQEAFDRFSRLGLVTAGGRCHGDNPQLYNNVSLKGSWLDLKKHACPPE